MDCLRRLRGTDQRVADAAAKGRVAFYADDHAETGDGFSWVDIATSPSGTFVLLWRDAPDDDSTAGYRTTGPGRFRLIEKEAGLRCEGRLERPNDGHVADPGTFVIADWLFTEELRGRLYVFAADGSELMRRDYQANIAATFIDPTGRYAAAQMASNPQDDPDDERFVCFDLADRSELWSKPLEVGRADNAEFEIAAGVLRVATKMFGRVPYGLTDGSVDTTLLRNSVLESGTGFEIIGLVEDESARGVDPQRREVLVGACLRASSRLGPYPSHAARALRIAGELLEATDPQRTLEYWERALALDAKVGLAKRVKQLRLRVAEPNAEV